MNDILRHYFLEKTLKKIMTKQVIIIGTSKESSMTEKTIYLNPNAKNKSDISAKRLEWIDLAKGITMILVIIGHTVHLGLLRYVIYSFHMSLFFIVSGVTYRTSENTEMFKHKMKKSFRYLILPTIVIYLLQIIIEAILNFNKILWIDYFLTKTYIAIFASGYDIKFGSKTIVGIGAVWFFVVLFISKTLYDYLHLKLKQNIFIIVVLSLSVCGVVIGNLQALPLSFDIALAVLPLYLVGKYIQKNTPLIKNTIILSISLLIWALTFFLEYMVKKCSMEFTIRTYPLYPLCFLTAIAGSIFILSASISLLKIKSFLKPLIFIGKNSMYLFWVHIMDYLLKSVWDIEENLFLRVTVRIIIDILFFIVLMTILSFLRKRKCSH